MGDEHQTSKAQIIKTAAEAYSNSMDSDLFLNQVNFFYEKLSILEEKFNLNISELFDLHDASKPS